MWWVVFTAVDLYIVLVLLDTMMPTLPPEKKHRAIAAKKIVIALLIISAIALVGMFIRR